MSTLKDAEFVRRQVWLMELERSANGLLSQANEDDPHVVSLAFVATTQTDGLIVLEAEFRDAAGMAVMGFGL